MPVTFEKEIGTRDLSSIVELIKAAHSIKTEEEYPPFLADNDGLEIFVELYPKSLEKQETDPQILRALVRNGVCICSQR